MVQHTNNLLVLIWFALPIVVSKGILREMRAVGQGKEIVPVACAEI